MARNTGKDIDTARRVVRDRDGLWHNTEGMQVAGRVLYYGRPIPDYHLFDYHELWAFVDIDLVVNRLRFLPAAGSERMDWYIEPDPVDVEGDVWRIRDGYLDVCLFEGERYRLEDAAELAHGLATGEIAVDESVRALRSLERVLAMLESNGMSGAALLDELAPAELPR